MSKARNIADLKFQNSVDIGTESTKVAAGTNAQRPSSPEVGDIRYNSDIGKNEAYDADGWTAIAPPPVISSVSPTSINEADTTQTVVVTGQKFDANASAVMIDSTGAVLTPTTSTRNSSSQVTITYSGGDLVASTNEPYDVKVTNGTGLSSVLEDAVSFNETPDWSTTSGTIATVFEDEAMSSVQLSATDPEGGSVTYSVASGSLPSGINLSSSGLISGTPNVNDTYNASGVQHNFSVDASDGANTTNRSFTILRKWNDGSSSSQAASSAVAIKSLTGTGSNGYYWINISGTPRQIYCDMNNDGGGWMALYKSDTSVASNRRFSSNFNLTSNTGYWDDYSVDYGIRSGIRSIVGSSGKTLVNRSDSGWLVINGTVWTSTTHTSGNFRFEFNSNIYTSNGTTDGSVEVGFTNYDVSVGGDFGIATSSNGLDHHNTSTYYNLNGGCDYMYLYNYGYGYKCNTGLSGWGNQTSSCTNSNTSDFSMAVFMK